MRHVTNEERRTRLGLRHALMPSSRVGSAEATVDSVVALHATDPATVYLSYWARNEAPQAADLERALYRNRSLVKQLAMRRTLFVFPRDLLAATWASASARVAHAVEARITKEIVAAGAARDGYEWLREVRSQVLAVLAVHPEGLVAQKLRELIPALRVDARSSSRSVVSQVLTYLGANADIVRGGKPGNWRSPRTQWTIPERWLGTLPAASTAGDGYRELVQRWLQRFGPGTEDDIVWWLGSTRIAVRSALLELAAVEVTLEGSGRGWLLPNDLDETPRPESWVALLPLLDPTVMGWRDRDFYFDRHSDRLFDRQGNAGTTVWVDGRVVGHWVQDAQGAVELRLLERVAVKAERALRSEAKRLTEWLGGVRLGYVRSPAYAAELEAAAERSAS